MKRYKIILFFLFFFVAGFGLPPVALYPQINGNSALLSFIKEHNAALVLCNLSNNKYTYFNPPRCYVKYLPASTFKIPNSLIGLETGVIPDSNYVIKWDGKPQPFKGWERDQSLTSAIYYSVVWYYQELARRVGKEKMQYWLDTLNYGNKIIGDSLDRFWLDNSLKISADEQMGFLKNLYLGKLPFSKRSMNIVKNILPSEKYKNAVLKYKTGMGNTTDTNYIAWLVGYVIKKNPHGKKDDTVYVYAFNVDATSYDSAVEFRNQIKLLMLRYLKVVN